MVAYYYSPTYYSKGTVAETTFRQGAVDIVYRRELATSTDPAGRRAQLVEEYTERFANPYLAAERGYVDDVIDPAETRKVLSRSLGLLRSKREELPKRKHGNVPL